MAELQRAAAVAVTRSEGDGEIYLVRRATGVASLGGFYGFVSGRVEPSDADVPLDGRFEDGPERAAALRELFEELGILAVTGGATAGSNTLAPSERSRRRQEVLRDPSIFASMLRASGRAALASELLSVGTFVTPPYVCTRFRAPYYVLRLPNGESPDPLPTEIASGVWMTPHQALARHARGDLALTFPTLESLDRLLAAGPVAVGPSAYEHPGGEMFAGVHLLALRAPTLPPATHTNTYVLGGEDLAVVDPAPPDPDEREALQAYLARLERRGGRVRVILLTHHHPDHVGAAAWLRARTAAPIAAHRDTAEMLAGRLEIDRFLTDRDEIALSLGRSRRARWLALHLPGHARGHLGFYERDRHVLLAGDLVAGEGTVVVSPPDGEMGAYMASLERARNLPLTFLFPGHGPPLGAPIEKLQECLAHRRRREQAILTVLARAADALAPAEIVPLVYADVSPAVWPLAEHNVRAHLSKLADEGRVHESEDRYRLTTPAVVLPLRS